jgi:heme oxygenase
LETRDLHEAIERDLDLVNPGLELDRYQRILVKFFGFYEPWERLAASVLRDVPEAIEHRRKTANLRTDLSYFGIDAGRVRVCDAIPHPACVPQALGCCYVTEGATLGGRFIARHIEQTLGISWDSGGRFFHGYGSDTGRMWKDFEGLLNRYCDNGNADLTVAAAQDTFRALSTWFREA